VVPVQTSGGGTNYTFSAAHTNLGQIVAGARTSAPVSLTNTTTTGGVFDADDISFASMTNGLTTHGLAIYKYNASEAAASLLYWFDTGISNFPHLGNGGALNIQWNASGIFSITG